MGFLEEQAEMWGSGQHIELQAGNQEGLWSLFVTKTP